MYNFCGDIYFHFSWVFIIPRSGTAELYSNFFTLNIYLIINSIFITQFFFPLTKSGFPFYSPFLCKLVECYHFTTLSGNTISNEVTLRAQGEIQAF